MPSKPSQELVTFANPYPQKNYVISLECPEFTCVCPVTGQPDFGCIYISYIPEKLCLELKSIKLYLWSYRDQGTFHEAVTNKLLEDFVHACAPRRMTVKGDFKVRGGIHTCVTVSHPDDKKALEYSPQSSSFLTFENPTMATPSPVPLANQAMSHVHTIFTSHEIGGRPWGSYEVLVDATDHKVKRVTVLAGQRLSLQRHHHRTEHWVIVQGQALFTLDGQEKKLYPGDVASIPVGAVHRIQNCGDIPLVFIETQRGDYFGEDDIVRLADDYAR